jgi:hypothetical protein
MTDTLTAEQKIRQTLTGSPVGEPYFQHEGESAIRWLTGGTLPDAWVTFHHEGEQIIIRCAGCQNAIGSIPSNYDRDQAAQAILDMRLAGHEQHKPADWPQMNISKSY